MLEICSTDNKKSIYQDQKSRVVIDVIVIIRKIKLYELETSGNNCHKVIEYARQSSKYSQRLDYVFDSYNFHSIKDCERMKRSAQALIALSNVLENTQFSVDMNMFWSS